MAGNYDIKIMEKSGIWSKEGRLKPDYILQSLNLRQWEILNFENTGIMLVKLLSK